MMRVLQVINGLGTGGAERSTAEAIEPLRERGIHVEIATLHERPEGVGIAAARRATIHSLPRNPWARLRALRWLIRTGEFDLVHTTIFDADIAGRLGAVRTGVPVLTSLVNTSYEPVRLNDPRVSRASLRSIQLADAVTGRLLTDHFHALTDAVADSAHKRMRIPTDRITIVPRGRSEARLGTRTLERRTAARRQLRIDNDTPMLLCVGRQEFQKGLHHAVEAHAELQRVHPGAQLVLAGRSGNASATIVETINRLGLEDCVTLLGHSDSVPDLMVAADVLLFPSLYEGLGGTLIEAMALELPIVTSDLPVTREVTAGAAEFAQSGSGTALASGSARILASDAAADRLRLEGRSRFESTYRLDAVMDRMADLMHRVAAGHGTASQ